VLSSAQPIRVLSIHSYARRLSVFLRCRRQRADPRLYVADFGAGEQPTRRNDMTVKILFSSFLTSTGCTITTSLRDSAVYHSRNPTASRHISISALEIDLNWRNFVLMPGGAVPSHFDIVHVPDLVPDPLRRDPWCEERTAVGFSALLGYWFCSITHKDPYEICTFRSRFDRHRVPPPPNNSPCGSYYAHFHSPLAFQTYFTNIRVLCAAVFSPQSLASLSLLRSVHTALSHLRMGVYDM
jgi:hypothetical protein